MIKRITFIGCLHLLYFTCSAQISGYLGKRFIVSTQINSMVAFCGPTASNRGYDNLYEKQKIGFALSNRLSLEGEYVISRSRSIFLGVSYYKTGMALSVTTPSLLLGGNNSNDSHSLFYNLSVTGINIGFNKYKLEKGAIPPLGKHFRFSIWANAVNGTILDKKTSFGSDNFKQHDKININPKRFQFGIGLGTQENYIYLDKLVLNVGWEIRLPYSLIGILNESSNTSPNASKNQVAYEDNSDFRLLYHDLFTMKIGFSYLAF